MTCNCFECAGSTKNRCTKDRLEMRDLLEKFANEGWRWETVTQQDIKRFNYLLTTKSIKKHKLPLKILAGWDDFRTSHWIDIIEFPEHTMQLMKRLLAIAA